MDNGKIEENSEFIKCKSRIEEIFTSNKSKNPLVLPWTKTEKVLDKSIYLNKSVITTPCATFFVGQNFPSSEKLIFQLKPLYSKLAAIMSEEGNVRYILNFNKIEEHYVIGVKQG